jgi:xanthine dehydrogenase FAD-binding subunit
MLICDEYLTPASLEEAFAAMASHPGEYRIVAGATDTYPWAREGRAGDVEIPVLIDVSKIPELRERRIDGGRIRLGAATPIQRFMDNPAFVAALPGMPRCAVWFADDQIRESATVGGNIVNASPAADCVPPLLAHNAVVEVASRRDGRIAMRKIPLTQFIIGPGKTALGSNELVTTIECDALPGYGGSFEKVGHRRSLVISLVCLAAVVKLDTSRKAIEDVRLAIGGIGPVPSRLADVEALLRGPVSTDRLQQAAELPVLLVASRTRREYRGEVVRGFVLRGLGDAIRAAGGSIDIDELEAA